VLRGDCNDAKKLSFRSQPADQLVRSGGILNEVGSGFEVVTNYEIDL
jgi:hypothetical protein